MSSEETNPSAGQYHHYSSLDSSGESSIAPTRPGTPGNDTIVSHTRRGRVRFNSTSEANDAANKRSSVPLRDRSLSPSRLGKLTQPKNIRTSPVHSRNGSITSLLRRTPEQENEDLFVDQAAIIHPVLKPRPSVLNLGSSVAGDTGEDHEKIFSALAAQERAQRIASLVGSHSAPTSARTSLDEDDSIPGPGSHGAYPVRIDDIPLTEMDSKRVYDGVGDDSDEDLEPGLWRPKVSSSTEAHKLVRAHTRKQSATQLSLESPSPGLISVPTTPTEERTFGEEYVPVPQQ